MNLGDSHQPPTPIRRPRSGPLPVIVVGADTPIGEAILTEVTEPDREVRAFVSDPSRGAQFKEARIKVALGDVSDTSHISGACLRCHTAVLVCEAAHDGREISFAETSDELLAQWARAVSEAGVRRVIWVADHPVPTASVPEQATVDATLPKAEIARQVAALDDAVDLAELQ